uniref:Uncharacterized protein n=1 Tax=viral metagenome TaxID=1070528 RepID=A0A6C0FC60_9ZZZZ
MDTVYATNTMNKVETLALHNLELLASLKEDEYTNLSVIENKVTKGTNGLFTTFSIKHLNYPVSFAFNRMLHYVSTCDDVEECKQLLELMDNALDVVSQMIHTTSELESEWSDLKHNLEDIEILVANEVLKYNRVNVCCSWAKAFDDWVNDCLDTVTYCLRQCNRYLYFTPASYILEKCNNDSGDSGDSDEYDS